MHAAINKPQSCVENKLVGKCRASAHGCDSWVLETLLCLCVSVLGEWHTQL